MTSQNYQDSENAQTYLQPVLNIVVILVGLPVKRWKVPSEMHTLTYCSCSTACVVHVCSLQLLCKCMCNARNNYIYMYIYLLPFAE